MQRVLVVDKDDLVCELLSEAFRYWPGTRVICANDGLQGSSLLRESHYDLVLLDGTLRGLSGFEVAAVAANVNTPALLIAAHPDTILTAQEMGYPFLAKPFRMEELLSCSRDAIARAQLNIAKVKASAARLQQSIELAKTTMAASQTLLRRLNNQG